MFVLKGTSVALRCNYGPLNARNMRLRLGIFFFFLAGTGFDIPLPSTFTWPDYFLLPDTPTGQ